jgi:hypothetical protein
MPANPRLTTEKTSSSNLRDRLEDFLAANPPLHKAPNLPEALLLRCAECGAPCDDSISRESSDTTYDERGSMTYCYSDYFCSKQCLEEGRR